MPIYKPTGAELTSFCEGMKNMYTYGKDVSPDLMIFPLRGAYPFYACYKKIAELGNEPMPESALLPIGTCIDVAQKKRRGLTKPEKHDVIYSFLDGFFDEKTDPQTLLLIDEVFNGGTILVHHGMVQRYLTERQPYSRLKVCAIEDGSKEQRAKYRNRANKYGYHTIRVSSLFSMDREEFLPSVRKNSDFSVEVNDEKLKGVIEHLEMLYRGY
jgi:hypothetical protein